jgi:hypothetical protein
MPTIDGAAERPKHLWIVERANQRRDRAHQLASLAVHFLGKHASGVRDQFKESLVKRFGDLAVKRPNRVERFVNLCNLFVCRDSDGRLRVERENPISILPVCHALHHKLVAKSIMMLGSPARYYPLVYGAHTFAPTGDRLCGQFHDLARPFDAVATPYAFDLLELDSADLRVRPRAERKAMLARPALWRGASATLGRIVSGGVPQVSLNSSDARYRRWPQRSGLPGHRLLQRPRSLQAGA